MKNVNLKIAYKITIIQLTEWSIELTIHAKQPNHEDRRWNRMQCNARQQSIGRNMLV